MEVHIVIQTTFYDGVPTGTIIEGVYTTDPMLPFDRSIGQYSKVEFRKEKHLVKESKEKTREGSEL